MLSEDRTKNVSIICGAMNRTDKVIEGIPNWLSSPRVGQVVIVDWTSTPPIPIDPRVLVLRVQGQSVWSLSKVLNLAAQHASCEFLCKMDADYRMQPELLEALPRPGQFIRGDHRLARNSNERSVNGFILIRRKDFLSVNGYNEHLSGWGFEDEDLYARLEKSGLSACSIPYGQIIHLPHSKVVRFWNSRNRHRANRKLAADQVWSRESKASTYRVCTREPGRLVLVEENAPAEVITFPGRLRIVLDIAHASLPEFLQEWIRKLVR